MAPFAALLLHLWALLLGLGLWALARARALLRGLVGWRSCGLVGAFPGLWVVGAFAGLVLGACGRLRFCRLLGFCCACGRL